MSEREKQTAWTIEDSLDLYKIPQWGKGLFSINEKGHLCTTPSKNISIDIYEVIKEIQNKKIPLPVVIRFHDILRSRVIELNETFNKVIKSYNYPGKYYGVYPVKVNPLREVIEEIVDVGARYNFGLEAGSKAELMAVLAYNTNPEGPTILNGYKDDDFIRLALLGQQIGRKIFIVVENISELERIIRLSQETGITPAIGLRVKMSKIGQGKWSDSTGDSAKFGLTIAEILKAMDILKNCHMQFSFQLLHFHIGSQISDIRSLKEAINEAGRIFARLIKEGAHLQYFDVGGGLGVDYDGSASARNSSINYTLEEYVGDIVFGIKQICEIEKVPCPHIISESGRALTAHHSCIISHPLVISDVHSQDVETKALEGEHVLVTNAREIFEDLTSDKLNESYNDINQIRDEAIYAFKLGVLGLKEKAMIDCLYWKVGKKICDLAEKQENVPDFVEEIKNKMISQYLCNFSVFQSAADVWAINQILPVIPIHRLKEYPSVNGVIYDITCDSDGQIRSYLGEEGPRKTVPLHFVENPETEEYFIGLFLTGAYQDVMGDMHNLFGRVNEIHVYHDDDDPTNFYIEEYVQGPSIGNVLSIMQYNPASLAAMVKKEVDKKIQKGLIRPRVGVELVDFFEESLKQYTYLK